ncbi:MAG: fluoride efflux transporter CrcB [Gemmatimonadaceae bacterium]
MTILAIAVGGALGSVLRYLLAGTVQRSSAAGFTYGTLAVNVVGCLIVGLLVPRFTNAEPSSALGGLLIVGFCGGFTTFSAFSIETVGLASEGEYLRALLYVFLSVTLCLLATASGLALARALFR